MDTRLDTRATTGQALAVDSPLPEPCATSFRWRCQSDKSPRNTDGEAPMRFACISRQVPAHYKRWGRMHGPSHPRHFFQYPTPKTGEGIVDRIRNADRIDLHICLFDPVAKFFVSVTAVIVLSVGNN